MVDSKEILGYQFLYIFSGLIGIIFFILSYGINIFRINVSPLFKGKLKISPLIGLVIGGTLAIYYIDLGDSFTKLNSDSNVEFMQEILKWGMEALIILGITKSALCPMNLKRICHWSILHSLILLAIEVNGVMLILYYFSWLDGNLQLCYAISFILCCGSFDLVSNLCPKLTYMRLANDGVWLPFTLTSSVISMFIALLSYHLVESWYDQNKLIWILIQLGIPSLLFIPFGYLIKFCSKCTFRISITFPIVLILGPGAICLEYFAEDISDIGLIKDMFLRYGCYMTLYFSLHLGSATWPPLVKIKASEIYNFLSTLVEWGTFPLIGIYFEITSTIFDQIIIAAYIAGIILVTKLVVSLIFKKPFLGIYLFPKCAITAALISVLFLDGNLSTDETNDYISLTACVILITFPVFMIISESFAPRIMKDQLFTDENKDVKEDGEDEEIERNPNDSQEISESRARINIEEKESSRSGKSTETIPVLQIMGSGLQHPGIADNRQSVAVPEMSDVDEKEVPEEVDDIGEGIDIHAIDISVIPPDVHSELDNQTSRSGPYSYR